MTEYWKSNPMHWCDICKCWMNDTKAAKLHHERGAGHQANLAAKLREMGKKADAQKRMEEETAKSMEQIEAAARAQYEKDAAAAAAAAGSWAWQKDAKLYYNQRHAWYYDPTRRWYYGGVPAEWTQAPPLPAAAKWGAAPVEGGPHAGHSAATAKASATTSGRGGAAAAAAGAGASGAAAGGGGGGGVVKRVVAVQPHPQALIGGHQSHHVGGRVGAAKGVGDQAAVGDKRPRPAAGAAAAAAGGGGKGGKPGGAAKPVDPAEAEALARREAARQRVASRTMASFGLS